MTVPASPAHRPAGGTVRRASYTLAAGQVRSENVITEALPKHGGDPTWSQTRSSA
jgi:hypothetical protein